MTLCIAWKDLNGVHFASDSRASFSNNTSFDHCVKVVSVPMKIYGPLSGSDKYPEQVYEQNIGMCFAGSFLGAYTIKETLIHTLASLQVIPGITDVSMDQICKLIMKFYKLVTDKLTNVIYNEGLSKLIVTGYCPKQNMVRTFLFNFTTSPTVTTSYEEILLKVGDIEFVGSGATTAKSKFNSLVSTPPLEILKEIIKDKLVDSVGGAIQYGSLALRNFRVYGIVDYFVDDANKEIETGFYYNGINLNDNPYIVKWDEFQLKQTYIDPFRDQINSLIDKGYLVK